MTIFLFFKTYEEGKHYCTDNIIWNMPNELFPARKHHD